MALQGQFFFSYKPSVAAVVIAALVFSAITAIHVYRFVENYKTKRIRILLVLSMASFNEVLGYVLRIPGSRSSRTGAIHALSPLLLLLTPLMVTSVIYYIFSKISTAVAPHCVPLKSSLMLKILSGVDLVCQLAISAGVMVAARANSSAGKGVLLAAIAIHVSNTMGFMIAVVIWQRRVGGKWTEGLDHLSISTQRDVLAIYIATGLIMLRSLLRFIEFACGPNGPFQDHEAPFYIYDFLPMAVVLITCIQWYDSDNIPTSYRSRDRELEVVVVQDA